MDLDFVSVHKHAKKELGQYPAILTEQTWSITHTYATQAMFVLNLRAFESTKYAAYDRFHGNGPYGEIPTKKGLIRMLGFALSYNKKIK